MIDDTPGSAPSITNAVEYAADSDDGDIEIALSENVSAIQHSDLTVTVDGNDKTDSFTVGTADGTNGRLVLTSSLDLTPNKEVSVSIDSSDNSTSYTTSADVAVTSATFNSGSASGTYEGSTIAYKTSGGENTNILIEKSDDGGKTWSHVFGGSTDANNHVFLFNTEGEDAGKLYNISETNSQYGVSFDLRPFSLSADAPSTGVKEESFSVDLSADAGNRKIAVSLISSTGDTEDYTEVQLSGSGTGSASLAATETGNYTVEAVDVSTGVKATTDSVDIEKAGETVVSFAGTSNNNERGDVIEIPLEMQNTNSGHVKIGTKGAHFRVYGTATDKDGDGQVTLLLNTYNVSQKNGYGVSAAGSDSFNPDSSGNIGVGTPLDTGTYDLEVGLENVNESATGLSTFSVSPRSTDSATTLIGSSSTSFEGKATVDSLTQSETVALQDKVIVPVKVSGIYGLLQEYQQADGSYELTSGSEENLSLKVEQTNPGKNSNGVDVPESEIDVVADAQNDTMYFVIDTNSIDEFGVEQEENPQFNVTFTVGNPDGNALIDSEESVTTQFTVTPRTASINTNDANVVEMGAGSEATISGTSTLAPGSTVSVEVRFDNNEFIQTNQATVQDDGSWSTTYDLSDAEVGNTFKAQVRGLSAQVDGEVVEGTSTATPPETTEEVTSQPEQTPTTTTESSDEQTSTESSDESTEGTSGESDGSIPGFGLSAALIALVGAALIALRNN